MKQYKAQCFFCRPYDNQIHSRIEREIVDNEFTQRSVWGFRVHERRQEHLHAVYIEKQIVVEKIIDPFGNSSEFERISYSQVDFQLSVSPPHLIIFQPPRTYRKLISQLAHFVDYTIAIQNKNVDLFSWAKSLENKGISGVVTKANIFPITYDKMTSGKLSLVSGNDLRKKIQKLLSATSYTVKQIKIIFDDKIGIPAVELFNNGKIVFSRPLNSENFKIFYETFYALTLSAEQSHSPDGKKRGGADANE